MPTQAAKAPASVRTFFALGNTTTIKEVAQSFEALTGTASLTTPSSSYLFALLVELRNIHRSDGAFGDGQRAKEMLQDFIAQISAEGEAKCRK
tara:strand:- start:6016 stop:6294 length:279 start_codon:yes stop_codon:yes gene_type:complete